MIAAMPHTTELTAAQKKKLLIVRGAMYRAGLTESQHAVRVNLQPDMLAKSALAGVVTTASAALGTGLSLRGIRDGNFKTILPLLISGFSLLAKRRALIKPALTGAIALTAAVAVARLAVNKKGKA
jgi:hypothetical protein